MKRIAIAAMLLFAFATLAAKAQALETPFTFNPASASCGGVGTNPGSYPSIYHVTTVISDATEFVNGEAVDTAAAATLDYTWQRITRSGRCGDEC